MKTSILTFIILITCAMLPAVAEDRAIEKQLRDALFAEEATRDLDQAIEAYNAVIAEYDSQRKFAATAVFRLAECYRKKDQKEAAIAAYQRLVKEFPEEETLARLAGENLAALGATPAAASDAGAEPPGLARDAAEIARIKKLVALSPDLINDPASGLLHAAAANSRLKVAEFLIQSGADVNLQSADEGFKGPKISPLATAAKHGHLAMTKFLFENGATPDSQAYALAVSRQRSAILDELLKKLPKGEEANLLEAAVANALQGRQHDYLKMLIAHGASARPSDLSGAISNNDPESVRVLIAAGVGFEDTALTRAIERGGKMFDLLWASGARGDDAFYFAAVTGQPEIALKVLAEMDDADKPDKNGVTPLGAAVAQLDPVLVKAVLAKGADPNQRSGHPDRKLEGAIPLTMALRSMAHGDDDATYEENINDIIAQLLDAGADIDGQDSNGSTAMHYAAVKNIYRNNNQFRTPPDSAIRRLLAAGPNLKITNRTGEVAGDSNSPVLRLHNTLRMPERAEGVWLSAKDWSPLATQLRQVPSRLSDVLLHAIGMYDPARIMLYRAGKLTPEIIDYEQIVRAGDTSADPMLELGSIVMLENDTRHEPTPQHLEFLNRAATKKVTVIRGDQRWHGVARPGQDPAGNSRTYDPGAGIVYAQHVNALLEAIHAPGISSDLTRVEVLHANGERTRFNALIAHTSNQADLPLRDGDSITLHPADPDPDGLVNGIWISRESALCLEILVSQDKSPSYLGKGRSLDLAEFISAAYANSQLVLPHPDLANLSITRRGEVQKIDFHALADDAMPPIELGDIVNIPKIEKPEGEWLGLDAEIIARLQKLLARNAQFQVTGGVMRELTVGPQFWQFPIDGGLRTARPLATPGDQAFEVLGLSIPMAIRALGYAPTENLDVSYGSIVQESTGFSGQLYESDPIAIPTPIIPEATRIIINVRGKSAAPRAPVPRKTVSPARQPGR